MCIRDSFTSDQATGLRGLGDWGGIVLLGKATNNNSGGIGNIEGLPVSTDSEYGGGTTPDDNDNSGSLMLSLIHISGQTVLLQGPIYVKNNAVLTIQAGVTVLGSKAVAGSALIVTKGAQLIANGTASAPIVFTSDQATGLRGLGDWGRCV